MPASCGSTAEAGFPLPLPGWVLRGVDKLRNSPQPKDGTHEKNETIWFMAADAGVSSHDRVHRGMREHPKHSHTRVDAQPNRRDCPNPASRRLRDRRYLVAHKVRV